jgi:hypothetical protein
MKKLLAGQINANYCSNILSSPRETRKGRGNRSGGILNVSLSERENKTSSPLPLSSISIWRRGSKICSAMSILDTSVLKLLGWTGAAVFEHHHEQ